MTTIHLIIFIAAALIIWVAAIYNGLIKRKNQSQEAWSDIDVQLKRRYDLIPNLLEVVKGYMKHEAQTFQKITEARNLAMRTQDIKGKAQAEDKLTQSLVSLFARVENYPDLKASQNFLALQDELSDTENKIQAARRFYNANARDYNIKLQIFPNNLLAGIFKFEKKDFFEIQNPKERKNVKLNF